MRHQVHSHTFGRKPGAKIALIKGLIISLVEHERIRTTLAKAKELRRHADRAITLGKKGDLGSQRLLISKTGSQDTAQKLIKELGPRFKDRKGGYTRILKMGLRPGDKAPMALIEFVDYKLPEAKTDETKVVGNKEVAKIGRKLNRKKARAKKHVREIKVASRRRNRK